MKRLVILLSLLSILLGGCSKLVDPLLVFNPNSYMVDTGDEVESVQDVTQAKTVIVVWFWTKCPHCRAEMADLQAAYGEFRAQDIEIVGVSVWSPREDVMAFGREYGITFPIVLDHGDPPAAGVPFILLVRDGHVINWWMGAVDLAVIVLELE